MFYHQLWMTKILIDIKFFERRDEYLAKQAKLKEWEAQHYAKANKDFDYSQILEEKIKSGEIQRNVPMPTKKHKTDQKPGETIYGKLNVQIMYKIYFIGHYFIAFSLLMRLFMVRLSFLSCLSHNK